MRNETDIPILVVSCDAYQDLWHPFFNCFFKYWSDCPFPVYLVSNTVKYNSEKVLPLLVGSDVDYSSNLIKALSLIEDDWVILWIEDRPPAIQVDTSGLLKLIHLAQSRGASYLRLIPFGPPAFVSKKEIIGELSKGTPYRVSMTVSLWKKSTLLKILKPGETAWDIEKRGGVQRSNEIDDKFYALSIELPVPPPIQDIHLVVKGQITWQGKKFLSQESMLHYLNSRSVTSLFRYLDIEIKIFLKRIYFYVIFQYKKNFNV
jgi:hypothetical protein